MLTRTLLQVLANSQWTANDFILDGQSNMLLEWEHTDYLLEHAPYMAAMPPVPEVALHDHTLGAGEYHSTAHTAQNSQPVGYWTRM